MPETVNHVPPIMGKRTTIVDVLRDVTSARYHSKRLLDALSWQPIVVTWGRIRRQQRVLRLESVVQTSYNQTVKLSSTPAFLFVPFPRYSIF